MARDAPVASILATVDIYKEGADLPWLDGAFYCRSDLGNISFVQSMGRVLRTNLNKNIARLYFPVLTDGSYTDISNKSYSSVLNYLYYISCYDPDIFYTIDGSRRINKLKATLFRSGSNKTKQDFEVFDNLVSESVINCNLRQIQHQIRDCV